MIGCIFRILLFTALITGLAALLLHLFPYISLFFAVVVAAIIVVLVYILIGGR